MVVPIRRHDMQSSPASCLRSVLRSSGLSRFWSEGTASFPMAIAVVEVLLLDVPG